MRLSLLAVALVLGCGGGSGAGPTPPLAPVTPPPPVTIAAPTPTPPPPTPPELRLPAIARPLHNDVELVIDPTTEDFTGKITTQLEILAPSDVIWLNGLEITIDHATLSIGGAQVDAVASNPKPGYLALVFPHALQPGTTGTLAITYRGKMHKDDGDGIYTAKEAGDWYAFTQFEATDARQAFPTFDEPAYKVPWRLTLHTKQALVALANMPIERETPEPNGMKATRFAETPALPSYLVAFAVGPFDILDAGKSRGGRRSA